MARQCANDRGRAAVPPCSSRMGSGAETIPVHGAMVDTAFLPFAGVHPLLGRNFSAEDSWSAALPRSFGGASLATSFGAATDCRQLVRIGDKPCTIVGVVPASPTIAELTTEPADVFAPLSLTANQFVGGVFVRLTPGASPAAATEELERCRDTRISRCRVRPGDAFQPDYATGGPSGFRLTCSCLQRGRACCCSWPARMSRICCRREAPRASASSPLSCARRGTPRLLRAACYGEPRHRGLRRRAGHFCWMGWTARPDRTAARPLDPSTPPLTFVSPISRRRRHRVPFGDRVRACRRQLVPHCEARAVISPRQSASRRGREYGVWRSPPSGTTRRWRSGRRRRRCSSRLSSSMPCSTFNASSSASTRAGCTACRSRCRGKATPADRGAFAAMVRERAGSIPGVTGVTFAANAPSPHFWRVLSALETPSTR